MLSRAIFIIFGLLFALFGLHASFVDAKEAESNIPQGVHISLRSSDYSEMVVTWSTQLPGSSLVQYGNVSGSYTTNVTGYVTRFTDGNAEGLQFVHRVLLTNLTAGSVYYYVVTTEDFTSTEFNFRTLYSGQKWSPSFIVFGDMGSHGSAITRAALKKEIAATPDYTAVLHIGDFAYNMFSFGGKTGDLFLKEIEFLGANYPYMTAVGNHETDFNFSAYINKFTMPGFEETHNMWYSVNIGIVHLISYSTEIFWNNGTNNLTIEQQYDFLKNDLIEANKNRDAQPWIIAMGHRPMYCSNTDHDECAPPSISPVRVNLEKLFLDQGVDVVLEAHEHSYERLWPVFNTTVYGYSYENPEAPIHLISGVAGCAENLWWCINPMMGPKGPWSAFREWLPGTHGYARMTAVNSTHLEWAQVVATTGEVQDSIVIVQENHGPFHQR